MNKRNYETYAPAKQMALSWMGMLTANANQCFKYLHLPLTSMKRCVSCGQKYYLTSLNQAEYMGGTNKFKVKIAP